MATFIFSEPNYPDQVNQVDDFAEATYLMVNNLDHTDDQNGMFSETGVVALREWLHAAVLTANKGKVKVTEKCAGETFTYRYDPS